MSEFNSCISFLTIVIKASVAYRCDKDTIGAGDVALSAARILQRLLAGAGRFSHVCSLVPGAFRTSARWCRALFAFTRNRFSQLT